jgi:hypothetical protein
MVLKSLLTMHRGHAAGMGGRLKALMLKKKSPWFCLKPLRFYSDAPMGNKP